MTAIPKRRHAAAWRIDRHTLRGQRSVVLAVQGPMAAAEMHRLRAPLESLLRDDADQVVLDLADTTWLDGSGVAAIGYLFKRLSAAGRRLAIAGACGQPRDLLATLGLAGLLAPRQGQLLPMAERPAVEAPAGPPRPRAVLHLVRAR